MLCWKCIFSSENPALIKSDVIVVPINQFRSMKTSVSFQVYKIAGSDFGLNLEKIEGIKFQELKIKFIWSIYYLPWYLKLLRTKKNKNNEFV